MLQANFFQAPLYRPLYCEGDGNLAAIDRARSLARMPVCTNHGRTVTVHLRHYLWSNGKLLTSEAVVEGRRRSVEGRPLLRIEPLTFIRSRGQEPTLGITPRIGSSSSPKAFGRRSLYGRRVSTVTSRKLAKGMGPPAHAFCFLRRAGPARVAASPGSGGATSS